MRVMYIIHGDDQEESRKKRTEILARHKDAERIEFDGQRVGQREIIQATQTLSFLAPERIISIDNLLKGTMSKEKERIVALIGKKVSGQHVLIWEDRKIDKTKIKKYVPHAQEILCASPTLLFQFLDAIGTTPRSAVLSSFHRILSQKDVEFVFVMLLWQWRNLIAASETSPQEKTSLSAWQAAKLRKQVQAISRERIIGLYRQLLYIDVKIKQGITPLSRIQLLDIFFISLYDESERSMPKR